MRRTIVGIFTYLALVLLSILPAAAQVTTADVSGHVTDPKGLAIVGAKVTVLNTNTGFQREVTSNDSGDFIAYQIPPGTYKISISKDGFATKVYDNAQLAVGDKRTLDASLTLATSSQAVTVQMEVLPLVETGSSEIQGS
ncbi:MAG: Oar protein, partial [Candidatus Acidoferrum typicum]|nr:Oar protein [Candidatus Acidoferrum typicum]